MQSERWRQVDTLFVAALEREAGQRAVFLDSACAGDEQLRSEVESLLAAHEQAGSFLGQPALAESARAGAADPAASLSGSSVSHYEVMALLGEGSMGRVYLARDLRLGRKVALKFLRQEFTQDPKLVRRFTREAHAASALNHPNIITIFEIKENDGEHFIATEFIDGQTLRTRAAGGGIKLDESLDIAIQVAGALEAAHAAGIVHRDIKPENIMVRTDGLVKVLDFGLAKLSGNDPVTPDAYIPATSTLQTLQTGSGTVMGTVSYMSPEQSLGQKVDHRTDIFSLGVVLYEMVTGVRPFTGDSPASISDAILHRAPASLSRERPETSLALQRIISRALEKDCAARYQTADELRNDLQQLARESNGARAWLSGWRVKAALGLGALVMLAGLLALMLRRQSPEVSPFAASPVKRITDLGGEEIFPSLSPDGQFIVYASPAAGNWDIYLQKIGERQAINLTAQGRHLDLSPVFSPDGAKIAFVSSRDGHGISLMDRQGRILKRIATQGHNPAWSPDGKELALADERIFDYEGRNHGRSRLFAVNVETGAERVIVSHDAVQPNWSPHGHRIAYWGTHKGGQRDIWTVSARSTADSSQPLAVTDDRAVDWNPVWSRDGRQLYFLSNRGGSMNLWRVPIDELTGRVLAAPAPATLPSANSQHLSFSADGRALVYVEVNRRENTYQVAFDPVAGRVIGSPVQITYGTRRHNFPEMSPDEQAIVYVSVGEAQEDVYVLGRDGAPPRQLTHDLAEDRVPRWSPDGRRITFVSDRSGNHQIWQVQPDGGSPEQLTDVRDAWVASSIWAPDGRRLLYHVHNVGSFIIEPDQPRAARTPQPLAGQPMPNFRPWSWSPDGKLLAGAQLSAERPSRTLMVYSFATQRYERIAEAPQAWCPIWLNDSRRLLYGEMMSRLYLLDVTTRQWREIYSAEPSSIRAYTLSPDNRRLYLSLFSSEADIWLMNLR